MVDEFFRHQLSPGAILAGNYEILYLIAEGGTGEVYCAASLAEPGLKVAIKTLNRTFASDPQMLQVVQQEAAALRKVRSDAVVGYHAMLKDESDPLSAIHFLVMDLVSGPTLGDYMAVNRLSMDEIWTIARRLCEGLEEVHSLQVLHGDISPNNVILRDGDPAQAILIDFGLARNYVMADHPDWLAGSGTVQYSSPEQLRGEGLSYSADFYSLGMTLLAVYNGRHIDRRNPPTDELPPRFRRVIEALIQEYPEDRAQRASDVRQMVQEAMAADSGGGGNFDGLRRMAEEGSQRRQNGKPLAPGGKTKGNGEEIAAAVAGIVLIVAVSIVFLVPSVHDFVVGPSLPTVSPYVVTVQARSDQGAVMVSGYAPSKEEAGQMLAAVRRELPRLQVDGDVLVARRAPNEAWTEAVPAFVGAVKSLSDWQVQMEDSTVRFTGEATAKDELDAARIEANAAAGRFGYQAHFDVILNVAPLPLTTVRSAVSGVPSCGALAFTGPDPLGAEDPVRVSGMVASGKARQQFQTALKQVANGRPLRLQIQEIDPNLCEGIGLLPEPARKFFTKERVGRISFILGYERKPGKTSDGVYYEGESAIIHARIGSELADGYLYVFFVDRYDQLVNILPHTSRREYKISSISEAVGSWYDVQLSYPNSMASDSMITLNVGAPFGNAMIVALATERSVFSDIPNLVLHMSQFAPELEEILERAKEGRYAYVLQPIVTKPR